MNLKSMKKVLSLVIVFTFMVKLFPVSALNFSASKNKYDLEDSEAISDLSAVSEAPPTFVYDEAYNGEEIKRPSHIFTDYYSMNTDTHSVFRKSSTDYYTIQDDTKEIDPIAAKIHDICVNNEYFSELSKDDASYILDNVNIDKHDFKELEALKLTLYDSVILASIIEGKDISLKDIYKSCSNYNEFYDLIINLLMYINYAISNVSDIKINNKLLYYILEGYSYEKAKTGYEIGEILGIDVSSLLDKPDEAVKGNNEDE